jgi:hypothetical protein
MRIAIGFACLVLVICAQAEAGIRYEFRQSIRTDAAGIPPAESAGRVTVEGKISRLEFTRSPLVTVGSYVIATQGTRMLYLVDPAKKTYSEVPLGNFNSAVSAGKVSVSNLKWNVTKLDDHPVIAGYPTDHYRFEATYDMTVMLGTLPIRQSVHTTIDKWTTNLFGDVYDIFLGEALPATGNPSVDALLAAESTKIGGFPLRQVTVIRTSGERKRDSSVKLPVTRTQSSELLVTSIEKVNVDPSAFQIPTSYRKTELAQPKEDAPMHTLQLEPEEE